MSETTFHIQMMGKFTIYMGNEELRALVERTPKGCMLIQFLILHRGESVPNFRILSSLWPEEESANPESALKTLVSRLRSQLSAVSPLLAGCLISTRGGYCWRCCEGMSIDLYEIDQCYNALIAIENAGKLTEKQSEHWELSRKMLALYHADLLLEQNALPWVMIPSAELHNRFMEILYKSIDYLKGRELYEEVAALCRNGLQVDEFDDRLHIELMNALIKTGRTSDALAQYKHAVNLNYRYLGITPSENIQEFYKQIIHAGKTLDFNLESIRKELLESSAGKGAFICEYAVFKEIYNLQMRNLERLGSTMFLAIIMVGSEEEPIDTIKQNNICNDLLEIMRYNLRKGDTVTHFSPNVFALLLPTVNYTTGNMVMERIKQLFFRRYPNSNIPYSYRVGPLSSDKK